MSWFSKKVNKTAMKKKTRSIVSVSIALFLMITAAACSSGAQNTQNTGSTGNAADTSQIKVVTTIFPIYDWVREITNGSKNVDTTLLIDSGVDLHSFQPSVDDIAGISECDLLIYAGGESDEWVEEALKDQVNGKKPKAISLLELLGSSAKEEEIVEGMEEPEEEGEGETEYDEHVWLSLKNAEFFTGEIADALSEIDPSGSALYKDNAKNYAGLLSALDDKYKEAADKASVKTLLFADRFPFRYMTDDYGLAYYAPFVGCSAETEASFDTITFLTKKLDELDLKYVFVTESSDKKIADTIIKNSESKDQGILILNSMQSVTSNDIKNGAKYIDYMEDNLGNLIKALDVEQK